MHAGRQPCDTGEGIAQAAFKRAFRLPGRPFPPIHHAHDHATGHSRWQRVALLPHHPERSLEAIQKIPASERSKRSAPSHRSRPRLTLAHAARVGDCSPTGVGGPSPWGGPHPPTSAKSGRSTSETPGDPDRDPPASRSAAAPPPVPPPRPPRPSAHHGTRRRRRPSRACATVGAAARRAMAIGSAA